MSDRIQFIGTYYLEGIDIRTGKVVQSVKCNMVMQNFFTGVFKFLDQIVSTPTIDSLNLTHMAIGDGTTAAMKSDTLLENETFRKALASKTYTSTLFTAKCAIQAAEGNPSGGFVAEVGIFAKATDTADSGTLISRAIVSMEKNANIKLNIRYELGMA